jgi:hypothetical protein
MVSVSLQRRFYAPSFRSEAKMATKGMEYDAQAVLHAVGVTVAGAIAAARRAS